MHKMRPMIALLLATFMAISGVPTEFSPDDTSQVIEAQEETGSDMDEPEGLGLEEESSTSDSADEKAEVDVIEQTDNDGISEGTEDPVTTEGVADTEESGDMEDDSEIASEDGTDERSDLSEEKTEEITVATSEDEEDATNTELAETEEDSEEDFNEETDTEAVERIPSFTEAVSGVSTAGRDFSSRELMIGTEDSSIFTWDTEVLSEYRGVYLTRYASVEETRNAYTYYYDKAEFVSANITFRVADTEDVQEGADLSNLNEGDDALANLNELSTSGTVPKGTIALIDTGVNGSGLVDSVSVLGDSTEDDNGHGTKMYSYIREEYPDAKVLSIKAMDASGKGQASDIYAAIQYALERKADVISLSLTANSSEENSAVVLAIEEAISKGVIVVGAAGNNASNAKYFIPGCVKDAYIIGAANEKGDRQTDSNYGPNVDYEVVRQLPGLQHCMYGVLTRTRS